MAGFLEGAASEEDEDEEDDESDERDEADDDDDDDDEEEEVESSAEEVESEADESEDESAAAASVRRRRAPAEDVELDDDDDEEEDDDDDEDDEEASSRRAWRARLREWRLLDSATLFDASMPIVRSGAAAAVGALALPVWWAACGGVADALGASEYEELDDAAEEALLLYLADKLESSCVYCADASSHCFGTACSGASAPIPALSHFFCTCT